MNSEEKNLYSYHTFIYPFSVDSKSNLSKVNIFNSVFKKRTFNPEEDVLDYNNLQYFLPKACNVLFGDYMGNDDYLYLSFDGINDDEILWYEIQEEAGNTFFLRVSDINIIYNQRLSIGLLTFECEYWGEKITSESTDLFHDAKLINDIGRRIYSPALTKDGNIILTAKSINLYSTLKCDSDELPDAPQNNLLSIQFPKRKKSRNNTELHKLISGNSQIEINDYLDDRMYTCCIVRDNVRSNMLEEGDFSNSSIYEFVFCDKHNECSCQNEEMLKSLISEHVYTRWQKYGTIQGITEYSLTCITNEDVYREYDVIDPFLTEYVNMVKLALLQRVEITKIERKLSKLIRNVDMNTQLIESKYEDYIYFQNSLLLPEVTFQEQGVDIYKKLKDCFKIEELDSYLNKEITDLCNIQSEKQGKYISNSINLMAIIGIVLALIQTCLDVDDKMTGYTWKYSILFTAALFLGGLYWFIIKDKERMSQRIRNINIGFVIKTIVIWVLLLMLIFFTR